MREVDTSTPRDVENPRSPHIKRRKSGGSGRDRGLRTVMRGAGPRTQKVLAVLLESIRRGTVGAAVVLVIVVAGLQVMTTVHLVVHHRTGDLSSSALSGSAGDLNSNNLIHVPTKDVVTSAHHRQGSHHQTLQSLHGGGGVKQPATRKERLFRGLRFWKGGNDEEGPGATVGDADGDGTEEGEVNEMPRFNTKFSGVVAGDTTKESGVNITLLSVLLYNAVRDLELVAIASVPCFPNSEWMGRLLDFTNANLVTGFAHACIDLSPQVSSLSNTKLKNYVVRSAYVNLGIRPNDEDALVSAPPGAAPAAAAVAAVAAAGSVVVRNSVMGSDMEDGRVSDLDVRLRDVFAALPNSEDVEKRCVLLWMAGEGVRSSDVVWTWLKALLVAKGARFVMVVAPAEYMHSVIKSAGERIEVLSEWPNISAGSEKRSISAFVLQSMLVAPADDTQPNPPPPASH
eukprot:CAMPEP_0185857128 /NCGR_PEP_ID=MMETSP1354-20130828/29348_1 /TAXON_ID=708628 /ORGANISM="Erythrolobus madagascarensis, Strain CCMP3276" /LENGTH=455 /DNA_ID=CAMNT_0028559393 /DNA_START=254 /DNA_END=1621 /DNA_ORIENTATION=+